MGKTLNKLNYLKETKSQIKTALNQFGAGITNDTFRSYVSKISDIYANWTKVTDEDSQINLTPTIKGKMNLTLNSTELTQDGTPSPSSPVDVNVIKGHNNVKVESKNIVPLTNQDITINNVKFKANNGNIKITGTSNNTIDGFSFSNDNWKITLPAGTYTLSRNIQNITIGLFDGISQAYGQMSISSSILSSTFTLNASKTLYLYFFISNGTTVNVDYNIQLEVGSTATDYVEHQEQNYPINLASKNLFTTTNNFSLVTGYTSYEILGTNSLSVTSTGTTYSYRYVRFKLSNLVIGQRYYVSANFVNSDDTTTIPLYIKNTADNTTLNSNDVFVSGSYLSFTATEPSAMIRFYANGDTAKINTCTWTNIMVSTSNEDTYEPYHEPIEYCKIGNYADQFFKNEINSEFYDNTLIENEYYLKKMVGKVVLDGSETYANKNITDTNIIFQTTIPTALNNSTSLSNYFKEVSFLWDVDVQGMVFYTNVFRMRIDKTLLSDVTTQQNAIDSFKSWLSQNNVNVYYVLTTPTYIHISQEDYPTLKGQLEDIYNNLKSYNGQTNITQTNDDLPFNINVSALLKGDEQNE